MSQHQYSTSLPNGQSVRVTVGYDRQLGEFFMNVLATGGSAEPEAIYSSLADPLGGAAGLEHYAQTLDGLGIQAPKSLFEQTLIDAVEGIGNRIAVHQADGSFEELMPTQAPRHRG